MGQWRLETTLNIAPNCKCNAGDSRHVCRRRRQTSLNVGTTINIGCTPWGGHMCANDMHFATTFYCWGEKIAWRINHLLQRHQLLAASTNKPECCAPRSLRTSINASMVVRDDNNYLWYVPTHPERSAPRPSQTTIFIRSMLQHPRYGLVTRLMRRPLDIRERSCNVLV